MTGTTGDVVAKDPQASAWPIGIDWTAYCADLSNTEAIVTSTWAVSGPDAALTTSSPSIVTGALKTQVLLSAGTIGGLYTLTNSVVTSSGVHDDRSVLITITDL